MPAPVTVFDHPRFPLLPDPLGQRMYANVNNLMEVALGARVFHVCVAVPTGLFTLMRDVFRVPPVETVHLSLEEVQVTSRSGEEESKFLFSLLAGDEHLYDLWMYSRSMLPAWILNPAGTAMALTQTQTTISDITAQIHGQGPW